jgi:hypothetical protein
MAVVLCAGNSFTINIIFLKVTTVLILVIGTGDELNCGVYDGDDAATATAVDDDCIISNDLKVKVKVVPVLN